MLIEVNAKNNLHALLDGRSYKCAAYLVTTWATSAALLCAGEGFFFLSPGLCTKPAIPRHNDNRQFSAGHQDRRRWHVAPVLPGFSRGNTLGN